MTRASPPGDRARSSEWRLRAASVGVALVIALVGCTPPPPPAPPPPAQPMPAVAIAPFGVAPWGTFSSARFEIDLPLPDGRGWRIDDHRTPWLSATHAASGSTLAVRTWVEEGRADRHRCEEQARLWRSFPDAASAEAVQQRSLEAPSGYDTFVAVGVVTGQEGGRAHDPGKPDQPVTGFALAFGGHGHRCFAWAFTTTGQGATAAAVIGERLAAMVDGSLAKVTAQNRLAPVVREPFDLHGP